MNDAQPDGSSATLAPSAEFQKRYRLVSELGRGSMGVVYRAQQEELGRHVAVKFPAVDRRDVKDRIVREARLLSEVAHPNIVRLFDAGYDGEEPYVVMEFVEGRTLEDLVRAAGKLDVKSTAGYVAQVLDGLAAAHAEGIVHRDIKPENVLITSDNIAKLADFGLARMVGGDRLTALGTLMGTPAYMAPEYVQGSDPDARCDLYAVGVTLFQTLTGRLPFETDDAHEMLSRQVSEAPPSLRSLRPDVPPELDLLVARALSKEPYKRPKSASAMALDLRRAIGEEPSEPRAAARAEPNPWVLIAGVLFVCFGAAFSVIVMSGVWP